MRPRFWLIVVAVAAVLGVVFACVSTYDFMGHLDRQVHGIHCTFFPGIVAADGSGSSGCQVALMSPYSSVLRESLWGGIPISLPAISVYLFLLYWVVSLVLRRAQDDSWGAGVLVVIAWVPLLASLVMGYIAYTELGTACKTCIGMYAASAVAFLAALAHWLLVRPRSALAQAEGGPRPWGWAPMVVSLVLGGLFVAVPVAAYALAAPNFDRYLGACGGLPRPEDPNGVLVSLHGAGTVSALEVLDPLCPACRGFEERLAVSQVGPRLRRQVLLLPLDSECNWMVSSSVHPGACAISEAILCAGERAGQVLEWAFAEQEAISLAAAADSGAAARMAIQRFPELHECIGSAGARARLNLVLRWAVSNQLPVLAPQLYVDGVKLCDEDTDLGLDYMLSRLVEGTRQGLRATAPQFPGAAAPPPPPPRPVQGAPGRVPSPGSADASGGVPSPGERSAGAVSTGAADGGAAAQHARAEAGAAPSGSAVPSSAPAAPSVEETPPGEARTSPVGAGGDGPAEPRTALPRKAPPSGPTAPPLATQPGSTE